MRMRPRRLLYRVCMRNTSRAAAKTHNLHPKRLRRILTDAGIITETDLPDFEVLFSATEAQEFLEQASGSVAFSAAQKRLGMTRSQMEALICAGLLYFVSVVSEMEVPDRYRGCSTKIWSIHGSRSWPDFGSKPDKGL